MTLAGMRGSDKGVRVGTLVNPRGTSKETEAVVMTGGSARRMTTDCSE